MFYHGLLIVNFTHGYPSGVLHKLWDHHEMKQPWRIWENKPHQYTYHNNPQQIKILCIIHGIYSAYLMGCTAFKVLR